MPAKSTHPLRFAYVKLAFLDDAGDEQEPTFKVFQVEEWKLRVRAITLEDGIEVEGDNLWVPWSALRYVREVGV